RDVGPAGRERRDGPPGGPAPHGRGGLGGHRAGGRRLPPRQHCDHRGNREDSRPSAPGPGPGVRHRGERMRKLTNADIKDLREYERERDAFRSEIIALKKKRRIALGDLMSIVFENAATMRFQIQEMARAERMLRDEQIAQELETYNELVPDDGELVATLFIEI